MLYLHVGIIVTKRIKVYMRKFLGILALALAASASVSCDKYADGGKDTQTVPIVVFDGLVDLADLGYGMYYGDRDRNSVGVYSIVLSDAVCFRDGNGQPYLDSEGDMIVLEFLAGVLGDDEPVAIPDGDYQVTSDKSVKMRINTATSYVKKMVGSVQYQYSFDSGKISVLRNDDGTYDISTDALVLKRGKELKDAYYMYSGPLVLAEWTKVAAQMQDLKTDIVDIPFTYSNPVYYGDLFGSGTGNYVISLATEGFMEDESGTVPGVALILNMFAKIVGQNVEVITLPEGTYTVYPQYNSSEFSMLYGLNMDGTPFGTYLGQVDKDANQLIEFVNGGTVEVSRVSGADAGYEDQYTLKYSLNLTSTSTGASTRKISGTWVGPLVFQNAASSENSEPLSTLVDDVNCDMSKVTSGKLEHIETLKRTSEDPFDIAEAWQLYLEPRMWTPEERELPWEERIEAWDPNGDVMILEFILPLGSNGNIAVEKNKTYVYQIQPKLSLLETNKDLYTVSTSKMGRPYDDIFYEPLWATDYTYMTDYNARRGFTWSEDGHRGNWYLYYLPGTWQNMTQRAPAVDGTVEVTRLDDGVKEVRYKFKWDLCDDTDARNKIVGEWEGPVTIGNTKAL